jgi:ABC-type branched-subunit amino acid transport system ATPase component
MAPFSGTTLVGAGNDVVEQKPATTARLDLGDSFPINAVFDRLSDIESCRVAAAATGMAPCNDWQRQKRRRQSIE